VSGRVVRHDETSWRSVSLVADLHFALSDSIAISLCFLKKSVENRSVHGVFHLRRSNILWAFRGGSVVIFERDLMSFFVTFHLLDDSALGG